MAHTCGLGCEADFRKSTCVSPLPDVRLNHERKFYNLQTLPSCFSCGILSFLKLSSTGIPETGKLHLFHPLLPRLRRSQGSGLGHSSRCQLGKLGQLHLCWPQAAQLLPPTDEPASQRPQVLLLLSGFSNEHTEHILRNKSLTLLYLKEQIQSSNKHYAFFVLP